MPQVCALFSIPIKHASRDFKALLHKECSIPKLKTELHSNPVTAIPLEDFSLLVLELAFKGNKEAMQASRGLAGLSLHQLFSDAFEKEVTVEDRQDFLKEWQEVRELARISHSAFDNAVKRNKFSGRYVHDFMTVLIFGDTAKMARAKALVHGELDASIGLNHQEDIYKMGVLYRAKIKFSNLRKGTWEERVKRAVSAVMA